MTLDRSDAAASGLRPSSGGAGLLRLTPVRTLREGGEGRVVLAYDPALSRWLAVKFVRLEPDARPLGEALLGKLAAFAKDMLEPAVILILESGLLEVQGPLAAQYGLEPGLYLYIVMPYIHGLPAHELARGPLGAKEAVALFVGAAKLLARLHAQGLVHLDLKPANVMVDVQGRVVLVDPLLALVQATSAYAAPEADLGPAADRYALGRLVAAVWTARYPTSQRDGLPELPEPAVELSGKERLAHGRFRKQLERLAGDPEGRVIDLVAAEAIGDDLGATDGVAVLAGQVERSPFHASLTEIESAQQAPLPAGATPLAPIRPPLAEREIRGRHHVARAWYLLALAVLSVIGAAYVLWAHQHRDGPLPDFTPPLRDATNDYGDIAFSRDAPERQGVAVRLADDDKVALDRALFKMQLPFQALSIAILSRDDVVVDRVDHPVPNQVYRWDVKPGWFNFEVDRVGFGPDTEPMSLERGGKRLVKIAKEPLSAPPPEPLPAPDASMAPTQAARPAPVAPNP
jgi:hypothetical protein